MWRLIQAPRVGHVCGTEGRVRLSLLLFRGALWLMIHSHSFKVVWVTNEEFHGASDIYGTPDYIATDLADAAKQIAAAVRG